MLLNPSSPPPSRPTSPLPFLRAEDSEGPRCGAESPATLVDRPLSQKRPESLKNTELLALAGTDYSVAVEHARSRSASVPQRLPGTMHMATPRSDLHAAFGEELKRTSTNPFRARLHAAEAARRQASLVAVEVDDRDWWAGRQV